MNGQDDIQTIVTEYITVNSAQLLVSPTPETFRKVAKRVEEGGKELRKLRLNAQDKKHLHLVQDAFTNTRNALEAAARLDVSGHEKYMKKANELAQEYERRLKNNGTT